MMNLNNFSVNEVLSNIKNSDTLLKNYGVNIDHKDKSLSDVLAEKNINKDSVISVLQLLNELSEKDRHWVLEPTANLINHIKNEYHNRHRLQLPILISLARTVEEKNQENPLCPLGLSEYLNELHKDLLSHMEAEEQILFPFLSEEKISYVFSQVCLAMHNHDHDIHMLNEIDNLTNNFMLPEDADETWKKLYVDLEEFKNDLLEHIRLENDILFEKCK